MKRIIFTMPVSLGDAAFAVPAVVKALKVNQAEPDFILPFRRGYHATIKEMLTSIFPNARFIKAPEAKDQAGFVGLVHNTDYFEKKGIPSVFKGYKAYRFEHSRPEWYMRCYIGDNFFAKDLEIKPDCTVKPDNSFDIIFVNGYSKIKKGAWKVKEYPHWARVAQFLRRDNYKMASIGLKNEFVPGTVNKCGIPFLEAVSLMRGAKLVIGNDTGLIHLAALLKLPVVYVITSVNEIQVYDRRFHKTAEALYRRPYPYCPCQNRKNGNYAWLKNECDQACREIPLMEVVAAAKRTLSGE